MKVCPVVTRQSGTEILMFHHPMAGSQLVKGTLNPGEAPAQGAQRELFEESGLRTSALADLGAGQVAEVPWTFVLCRIDGDLPDVWDWNTLDDCGHRFSFFWHKLTGVLPLDMAPIFVDAYHMIIPRLQGHALQ
jgi:8-oxo-dGTP pyrophosphatase MutT (NUDIX family)